MKTVIIDGRQLAQDKAALLKTKVERFIRRNKRRPSLLAIELSDDPASLLYLKLKRAAAERMGIEMEVYETSSVKFRKLYDIRVDGIFVQHPRGFDKQKWQKLADQIPPEKDVDCLTTENLNLIKQGKPRFLPATVKAIEYCLSAAFNNETMQQFNNLFIVILGRSPIVGLPLSWRLVNMGANVKLLHSNASSRELRASCRGADILISAVGKPGIVTADMVKPGAVVIDCGSPIGDIDFNSVAPKTAAITPVPGGVGPLTVISLMENVVQSAYLTSQKGS